MQSLEKRIAALEVVAHKGISLESSDEDLLAYIAEHLGHIPTNEELQALAGKSNKG